MAPFVVFSVNQPKQLFVVESAVTPVEKRLVEAVEQEEMREEFADWGKPREGPALGGPRYVDQGHHCWKDKVAGEHFDEAGLVEIAGWGFPVVDSVRGKPAASVGESPEAPRS